MEREAIKVMFSLRKKFGWEVKPTIARLAFLTVAHPQETNGWNLYAELTPQSAWANLFSDRQQADTGGHVTIIGRRGQELMMRSPTRPGRRVVAQPVQAPVQAPEPSQSSVPKVVKGAVDDNL